MIRYVRHFQHTLFTLFIVSSLFFSCLAGYVRADTAIKTLHIATPIWPNQTNTDGTGLYFDILRAVYEPLGIQVKYQFMPWKRAMHFVLALKADALLAEYDNDDMLMPWYPIDIERTIAIFKQENIPVWQGGQTLEGKRIVWIRGYDYHKTGIFKDIQFTWHEISERKFVWVMLEQDRMDFYIDAFVDIKESAESEQIDMTAYRIETLFSTNTYMGFGKSERTQTLADIYDQRIPQLLESGELQDIFEKWKRELPSFELKEE